MKQITEEQIREVARIYSRGLFTSTNAAADFETGFDEGAKWMQEQLQPEWISVNDRLPEIGVFVLVHRLEGYYSVDQYRQYHGDRKSFMYNVTHWQLLPEPPNS